MKKIILALFVSLFIFFLPNTTYQILRSVSAHIMGQPPFFTVNGKLSGFYHVPLTTSQIKLPLDSSPEEYLVDQRLDFKIETAVLPYTPSQLQKSTFEWDFGDGTKATGLANSHTYTKPGSYILSINLQQADQDLFALQATLVHVKPSKNYELPTAKIVINGQEIKDPLSDVIYTDFNKSITFTTEGSTGGASQIKNTTWVFEETTQQTKDATYQFDPSKQLAFAIVRITTADGFFADNWVQLTNTAFDDNDQITQGGNSPISGWSKRISELSTSLVTHGFNESSNPLLFVAATLLIFVGGGLHAITPGHGKSLMGVYLLGKRKGKFSDVLLITSSITFTHTIAIFLLGFIFLALEQAMSINQVLPYFEKVSALIVIFLSINLILNGYRNYQHMKAHMHGHDHHHEHHHDQIKIHGKKDLLLVGVSGGILPCIDAFAILTLAVGAGKILLGIFLVVIFSLGLAATITLLGYALIHGKDKLKLEERFGKTAEIYGPIVSGSLILLLALRLLFK